MSSVAGRSAAPFCTTAHNRASTPRSDAFPLHDESIADTDNADMLDNDSDTFECGSQVDPKQFVDAFGEDDNNGRSEDFPRAASRGLATKVQQSKGNNHASSGSSVKSLDSGGATAARAMERLLDDSFAQRPEDDADGAAPLPWMKECSALEFRMELATVTRIHLSADTMETALPSCLSADEDHSLVLRR